SNRVRVTPLAAFPPATTSEQVNGLDESSPVILYIGRLETKKNLSVLIEAFKRLSKAHNPYLVLAGNEGYGSQMVAQSLAALPEETRKRVVLPGYVTDAKKRWLHERATVAV